MLKPKQINLFDTEPFKVIKAPATQPATKAETATKKETQLPLFKEEEKPNEK